MKIEAAPFDVAAYLDSDATMAEYLTAALEDPNPHVFLAAVNDVARARGMNQVATGLEKPGLDTVQAILRELGFKLRAEPAGTAPQYLRIPSIFIWLREYAIGARSWVERL